MPDTIRIGGMTHPIAPVPGRLFQAHLPALQSLECKWQWSKAKIAALADIVFLSVNAADPKFTARDLDRLPATLDEFEIATESIIALSHRTFRPSNIQ